MTLLVGIKNDSGKSRWTLFPWDAARAVMSVITFGAEKYAPRNWELGMDWSRVYDACLRHVTDWHDRMDKGKGPGKDKDTGFSDLWHAGCCILFLIAYEIRGVGRDDRPEKTLNPQEEFPFMYQGTW